MAIISESEYEKRIRAAFVLEFCPVRFVISDSCFTYQKSDFFMTVSQQHSEKDGPKSSYIDLTCRPRQVLDYISRSKTRPN